MLRLPDALDHHQEEHFATIRTSQPANPPTVNAITQGYRSTQTLTWQVLRMSRVSRPERSSFEDQQWIELVQLDISSRRPRNLSPVLGLLN